MLQDVPADISERSSGIREERRRSRREFCICRIDIITICEMTFTLQTDKIEQFLS